MIYYSKWCLVSLRTITNLHPKSTIEVCNIQMIIKPKTNQTNENKRLL